MDRLILSVMGIANTGKSTTAVKIGEHYLKLEGSKKIKWESDINNVDIYAEIEINGRKICIISQGDPGSDLENKILKASKKDFTVIVCTCRTRGTTVSAIQKHHREFDLYWLRSDTNVDSETHSISQRNIGLGIMLVDWYLEI